MSSIRIGKSSKNKLMHYGVAAFIKKKNKYFLIKRATFPKKYSFLMGHVDLGEDAEKAIVREVMEESGLIVDEKILIGEGELEDNPCRKGADCHFWKIYSCDVSGDIEANVEEVDDFGWFNPKEIKKLDLEKTTKHWLERLGII